MNTEAKLRLAERLANELGEVPGVVAVTLGGSLARGAATPESDIDLGLYYRSSAPFEVSALRELAGAVDDRGQGAFVTDLGGWGPWIGGGGWLSVEGERVDWLYRDLEHVRRHLDACSQGRVETHYQPCHPHGFSTDIYLAEVAYAKALYDPTGVIAGWQSQLGRYPPLLKRAMIDTQLWQARLYFDCAKKGAARRDSGFVAGGLFQSALCLTRLLFALNERYYMNEKGAIDQAGRFAHAPPGFADETQRLLAGVGRTRSALSATLERFSAVLESVVALAKEAADEEG